MTSEHSERHVPHWLRKQIAHHHTRPARGGSQPCCRHRTNRQALLLGSSHTAQVLWLSLQLFQNLLSQSHRRVASVLPHPSTQVFPTWMIDHDKVFLVAPSECKSTKRLPENFTVLRVCCFQLVECIFTKGYPGARKPPQDGSDLA